MRLDINTSRIDLNNDIREYIERRAQFALGRFDHAVVDVAVSLEDTNGPRGGVDQQCRIRVHMVGERSPLLNRCTHEEIKTAIDMAFESSSRAVAKSLDRRTKRQHAAHFADSV